MIPSGARTSRITLGLVAEDHGHQTEDDDGDPEPARTEERTDDPEYHGYRDRVEAGRGANHRPDQREDGPDDQTRGRRSPKGRCPRMSVR